MQTKKYKPQIDKIFWITWIFTSILLLPVTVVSFFDSLALIIMIFVDIFVYYFMFSSISGYVLLKEKSLYVKFGFILKRDIPYDKIRKINKERKLISYSFLSLKNAIEHVNIEYNKFDMITVSVVDNDDLINEINERINK